jgi:PAS domain S-box-containing protein
MTVCIFTLDLVSPAGVHSWLFYAVPLLIVAPVLKAFTVFSLLITILMILGHVLSPAGEDTAPALANRVLGISVFWLVFFLTHRARRTQVEPAPIASAVESAGDAVVITDSRGIIRYVNPSFEKMTGYAREEAAGRDLHILESGKHDKAFYLNMRSEIHRRGKWSGRLVGRKKDGTFYQEECTSSPVKDSSGAIIGYISIKRDMTERTKRESAAQGTETMNNIGDIFAGVRHEISNPVNSIKLINGILRKKLDMLSKDQIVDFIDKAETEISRIDCLLYSMRNYNMYERLEPGRVKTASFMENVLALLEETIEKKGALIAVSLDAEAESMYVDARALQQVLLNILVNALDAVDGRNQPKISVHVLKREGTVLIRVEDNGPGIPEEILNSLFKPFTTTKAHGTGLGLVIARKMLFMMNGSIDITSRKDEGTVVEVIVPADS